MREEGREGTSEEDNRREEEGEEGRDGEDKAVSSYGLVENKKL